MSKKNKVVELQEEIRFRVAEHQVLLSFVNDEDALYFREWWEDEGEKMYMKALGNPDE